MKRIFSLIILVFLAFNTSLASAEGFNLTDYSARGTALGATMVGRADDASALAYNPAGITQLEGVRFMFGATVIAPTGTVRTYQDSSYLDNDVKKKLWLNPHFYFTQQISEKVFWGIGLFSRFGLGNSYDDDWVGRYGLQSVNLKTFSINPNIAVKATDKLSLAFGIELMYGTMEMERMFRNPSGPTMFNQKSKFKGDGLAPGFNLALHYKFNEQWAMGLSYRSGVVIDVAGQAKFSQNTIAGSSLFFKDSDLSGKLKLPDQASFGLLYKPMPSLSFELGTVYTAWSKFKDLNIDLEGQTIIPGVTNMNQLYSAKKWKDTWSLNFGVEYQALKWLALRAGYIYETSPMNKATMDYMTPSNGRQRFSVGLGFNFDDFTVDIAYSYLWIKGLNYNDSANSPLTSGILAGSGRNGKANIASVSVGYKF